MKIEVKDLYKSFNGNNVLQGVNLEIPEGRITCIVGGSGSGKSVLLKHLNGILRPDSGHVVVDGKDISGLPESSLYGMRRRMALIFQSGGLLGSLNVGENVGLGLKEHNLASEDEIRDIVREKLDLVQLGGIEDKMPANLSGGMKKRVSIARGLTLNPELILYDEPTAGLDPPMAQAIDDLILELSRDLKVTSVVVTHDLTSVFKLADTVNMLYKGNIIESAPPEKWRESDNEIIRNFIGREVELEK